LIATDACGRGIDVQGVAVVINFELPTCFDVGTRRHAAVEKYIQRAGRSGRFGRAGVCITVVSKSEERDLEWLSRSIGLSSIPALTDAMCESLPGYGQPTPTVEAKAAVAAAAEEKVAEEVQRPAGPLATAEPTMTAARAEVSPALSCERETNSVAQTRSEVEAEVRAQTEAEVRAQVEAKVRAEAKAEAEAKTSVLQAKHGKREQEMLAREQGLLSQIAALASELEQERAKAAEKEKDVEDEDDCSFMVGSILCSGSSIQNSTRTLSSAGTPSCVAAGAAVTEELDRDDASTISSNSSASRAPAAPAPAKSSCQTRKEITLGRDTFQAAKLVKGERFVGEVVKLLKKGKGPQAAFVRFGDQAGRCEKDGRVFGSGLKLGSWIDVAVHDVQISRQNGAVKSRIELTWV